MEDSDRYARFRTLNVLFCPFSEGSPLTATADTNIPNILAASLPVPRVLATAILNKSALRHWIDERRQTIGSIYPAVEQIDKVTESDGPIVLIEQAEDDVRVLDIEPPFGSRRTSGPYSFPRALSRAARAFIREIAYFGDGDIAAGETTFLATYGSPTLAAMPIAGHLQEMGNEQITQEALHTYCAIMAGEIGRTYGAILNKAPAIREQLGTTITMPLADDLQNWSLRGRYHDYEVLRSGPPITEKESLARASLCTELQTGQVLLLGERVPRSTETWRRQYMAQIALEAFQYSVSK